MYINLEDNNEYKLIISFRKPIFIIEEKSNYIPESLLINAFLLQHLIS